MRRSHSRFSRLLLLTWTTLQFMADGLVMAGGSLSFEKEIRPILKAHCFHCHGEGGVTEGELDVRLRRWLIRGGDSGEAIVPGHPKDSLLLERIEAGEMPPGDKRLAQEELELIRKWIAEGAPTAREEPEKLEDGDYMTEEERNFWSFQPIRRPMVPVIEGDSIHNSIDAFVLDRLRAEGLGFSDRADRYTLIRRLSFDLLGLPPTPAMVQDFLNDHRPGAYRRLVDQLLSSPEYGQRWGRHWLDVAGYADSDGYTNQDSEREFAYFYRDYVIDSFNGDKRFDQFVSEQLAGDEMADPEASGSATATSGRSDKRIERLTATGFLRMAPDGTASGGEDRAVAANENIADTINIVSTSLMGLTIGCARCHDHRYDPISQLDYYRFRAIFEPALDWKQWKLPKDRRVSLYTSDDRKEREAVEARAKQAEAARSQRQQEHIDRTLSEELLVVPDERRDALKIAFKTEKAKRSAEQVALLEEYPSVGNISPGSLYLYAEQRARRAGDIEKEADKRQLRYIAQARRRQVDTAAEENRPAFEAMLDIPQEDWSEEQKSLAESHPDVFVTADSLEQVAPDHFAEIKRYREAAKVCRQQDAKTELAELAKGIQAIRSEAPKENFVRVLTEPENHVPPTHLFIRGDHNQPSVTVAAGELKVLEACVSEEIPENDSRLPTTGRRLAYARHLTSGKHPLLARVIMNRIWMHHFGRGIVDSPGDFGRLGAKPSHPRLLDWLSDQFMAGGWSLKQIHRMLLLSRTYQQSSRRTEPLDRMDPENRLYGRMSVRRLESEAIRDAMLAASGELTTRHGGPPVPVMEDAVGQIVIGREMLDGERKPKGSGSYFEGICRRSVYVQVRRSRPLAVLETFDIATVSPNCTQRNSSNVAMQALLMMNSPFAVDRANRMADLVIEKESEVEKQLALAWLRCFGNPIDDATLASMREFVARQADAFRSRDEKQNDQTAHRLAIASACQAMLGSNHFLYVD